ncbi:MAG: hypothetical protein AAGK92_11855 [Pseudomonadota bacterium]
MSFFARHQRLLLLLGTAYVLGLVIIHARLPPAHVWWIAAAFSILMNIPYVIESRAVGAHAKLEVGITSTLIALSLAGPLIAPPFVIIAIFAHGLWDISKHHGVGVPFASWYTLGCAVIDILYGTALLIYWLTI